MAISCVPKEKEKKQSNCIQWLMNNLDKKICEAKSTKIDTYVYKDTLK